MTELEKKLRELKLWTKFKKAVIKENGENKFNLQEKYGFTNGLQGQFIFEDSEEGHDFWMNISKTHKI